MGWNRRANQTWRPETEQTALERNPHLITNIRLRETENGASQRRAPAPEPNEPGGAYQTSFAAAGTTKHERRRAVVDPILKAKQWTVNKWGTQAGVGKNCAYDYLGGRRNLSNANRLALAQVLGLTAEDLPN
jgi:hypothetical protein